MKKRNSLSLIWRAFSTSKCCVRKIIRYLSLASYMREFRNCRPKKSRTHNKDKSIKPDYQFKFQIHRSGHSQAVTCQPVTTTGLWILWSFDPVKWSPWVKWIRMLVNWSSHSFEILWELSLPMKFHSKSFTSPALLQTYLVWATFLGCCEWVIGNYSF